MNFTHLMRQFTIRTRMVGAEWELDNATSAALRCT